MIDWSFNVGNIITIFVTLIGFGFGAVGLYYGLRLTIQGLVTQMEILGGRFINFETEMREVRVILAEVAVQEERYIALDRRLEDYQRSNRAEREWVREQVDKLRDKE